MACVVCGRLSPATAMDMTGHGWRCAHCTLRSEIVIAEGGSAMADHLTPSELVEVAVQGGRKAAAGAGLVLLCIGVMVAVGGPTFVVGSALTAGFGMFLHGLHRRRQARLALRDVPTARLLR